MAEVLPQKKSTVITAESINLGGTAETLATAGATIPQNTGDIEIVVTTSGDQIHWLANATPTETLGNRITHGHTDRIPHSLQKRAVFKGGDSASPPNSKDVAVILIYHRGSSRQDLAYSATEPF